MRKFIVVLFAAFTLTACHSGVNFEFATSQDNQECLKENPSNKCGPEKN